MLLQGICAQHQHTPPNGGILLPLFTYFQIWASSPFQERQHIVGGGSAVSSEEKLFFLCSYCRYCRCYLYLYYYCYYYCHYYCYYYWCCSGNDDVLSLETVCLQAWTALSWVGFASVATVSLCPSRSPLYSGTCSNYWWLTCTSVEDTTQKYNNSLSNEMGKWKKEKKEKIEASPLPSRKKKQKSQCLLPKHPYTGVEKKNVGGFSGHFCLFGFSLFPFLFSHAHFFFFFFFNFTDLKVATFPFVFQGGEHWLIVSAISILFFFSTTHWFLWFIHFLFFSFLFCSFLFFFLFSYLSFLFSVE